MNRPVAVCWYCIPSCSAGSGALCLAGTDPAWCIVGRVPPGQDLECGVAGHRKRLTASRQAVTGVWRRRAGSVWRHPDRQWLECGVTGHRKRLTASRQAVTEVWRHRAGSVWRHADRHAVTGVETQGVRQVKNMCIQAGIKPQDCFKNYISKLSVLTDRWY